MKRSESLILFFFLMLFPGTFSCISSSDYNSNQQLVLCDAETLNSDSTQLISAKGGKDVRINLGGTLSKRYSRSGRYSVRIDKRKPFAFTYVIKPPKQTDRYIASIWRYDPAGKAGLIVAGNDTRILYKAEKKAVERDENGWELLKIEFDVDPKLEYIKIYAWNIDSDSAWFDDLRIEKRPPKKYPAYTNQAKIHLYFDAKDWAVLENSRQQAFEKGILEQGDDDWAKGIISDEKEILPVKARLKGDWLDHLEGDKWSFRIKMRKSTSLNGLTVFSLQNPLTRSTLMEYVAHELFKERDVLTTRYGFIPLYLNGESKGIYALEEHFSKQLIEANQRREGLILKFDEKPFWGVQKYFIDDQIWHLLPYFQAAIVEPFQENKAIETPGLSKQFSIAQKLLYQYKTHQKPLNQIFDLEKLANYWALIDLTKARHGMAWHNQRFYYNPVLCLLEPLAYDAYSQGMEKFVEEKAIFGDLWFPEDVKVLDADKLLFHIFQDTEFQQLYLQSLTEVSNEIYLKSFYSRKDSLIGEYESLIREEFESYHYDTAFILNSARQIRKELPLYSKRLQKQVIGKYPLREKRLPLESFYQEDLVPLFVNAFLYKTGESNSTLRIENYFTQPIELVGLRNARKQLLKTFPEKTYQLKAYNYEDQVLILDLEQDSPATELAFRVEGKTELLYAPIHPWEKQTGESPRQELLRQNNYLASGLFTESKDTLRIKTGHYQLKSKLIVPENKILYIEKGVKIDLTESAGILSFSPIVLMGTEKQAIQIFSSDSTGQGLSVFKTKTRNRLEYVEFNHLCNFSFKGWELTGAVNFYEADVDLDHVQFNHTNSEDALNIIRSEFSIDHSSFNSTFADAFDGDFVKGEVANTQFLKIGNDAFDFSGSQVVLSHCEVKNAGDKGVSAGENSQLKIDHLSILNANIGIASKDLSRIDANDILIADCRYGLLAFQKKPEYGPASIVADKISFQNVDSRYLVEKESRLQLDKIPILGSRKKLSKEFYEE